MKTNTDSTYFTWSDAWVFTALYYSHKNGERLDLSKIIGAGDALNHAIISTDELRTALAKLLKRGIISINYKTITYTDVGKDVMDRIERTRGGLFSRVDITLQKLNSSKIELPYIEEIVDSQVLSDGDFAEAYIYYTKKLNK